MSHPYPPQIVVIGGSAGSVRVVIGMLETGIFPLSVPVIMVLHRPKNVVSELDIVLSRPDLAVREPVDKEPLLPGGLYLAPQNYHLLVDEGVFNLDTSEPVNFSRPAIDVTFESVADAYAGRALGILLSGANQDGSWGLTRIISRGGIGIVQRPDTADYADMPRSALATNPDALALSPLQIIDYLNNTFVVTNRP